MTETSALTTHRYDQAFTGNGDDQVNTTILVVEDDMALQEAIVDTLELSGFASTAVCSAEQALDTLAQQNFDMVISDVNMGGMDGHALLEEIKRTKPFLPVLLITAFGSIERSVKAIQSGAADYLVKPFEPKLLISLVERYALGQNVTGEEPIAVAPASRQLFDMAKRVAVTDSTVLISGASGTGKEVVARYIHSHSERSKKPFVAINCAAIPESMLEATLFGHEKGAFTGAHQAVAGKFEQANEGTLLLDEISEMDLGLQAKLLRVLQEREVERVGGRKVIPLDLRIIATTNRELRAYVDAGKFREDLFYRLSVFPLVWPTLAQRKEDILPLAEFLLAKQAKKMGRGAVKWSSLAKQYLLAYGWPGNVRELDNIIQRALILQSGAEIQGEDLLFDSAFAAPPAVEGMAAIISPTKNHVPQSNGVEPMAQSDGYRNQAAENLEGGLKLREYEMIRETLENCLGSRKSTAEKLGISARTLRYKMAKMREEGWAV